MRKNKIIKTLRFEIAQLINKKYGYIQAGYPAYNRLFGRDSIIASWQLLNDKPQIARATLKILAKFQGKKIDPKADEEPGKILHETKGYFPFNY